MREDMVRQSVKRTVLSCLRIVWAKIYERLINKKVR